MNKMIQANLEAVFRCLAYCATLCYFKQNVHVYLIPWLSLYKLWGTTHQTQAQKLCHYSIMKQQNPYLLTHLGDTEHRYHKLSAKSKCVKGLNPAMDYKILYCSSALIEGWFTELFFVSGVVLVLINNSNNYMVLIVLASHL